MEFQERQTLLDQLAASESTLLGEFNGLTDAQWHFRESPQRWSIADNLEHLILHETFIGQTLQRILEAPPELDKMSVASSKDAQILGLATSRDKKINAREVAQPTGRWPNPAAMIILFRETRAQTVTLAGDHEAQLREHFFPHLAFGDLDCYQWLTVIAKHTLRHVAQIEQVKADPAYPAS